MCAKKKLLFTLMELAANFFAELTLEENLQDVVFISGYLQPPVFTGRFNTAIVIGVDNKYTTFLLCLERIGTSFIF